MMGTLVQAGLIGDIFNLIMTDPFIATYVGILTITVIFGLITLAAFYGMMLTHRWSPIVLIPASIVWIAVGYVTFVLYGGTLLIPLVVLGVLGMVFAIWSFLLIYRQGVTYVEVKTGAD
jgi:hypothetical protein